MRYNEFLRESNDDMFERIMSDCKPYLQEINYDVLNNTMYRGMEDKSISSEHQPKVGKKTARLADRTPVDTPKEIHDDLNDYFTRRFGHPFRNGIFTTNMSAMASAYGSNVYGIFPIGKYEYIWSPDIVDLYSEILEDTDQQWMEFAQAKGMVLDTEDDFIKMTEQYSFIDLLEFKGDYTNKNITTLMKSPKPREIMLWTKEYYFLNTNSIEQSELEQFQTYIDKNK